MTGGSWPLLNMEWEQRYHCRIGRLEGWHSDHAKLSMATKQESVLRYVQCVVRGLNVRAELVGVLCRISR